MPRFTRLSWSRKQVIPNKDKKLLLPHVINRGDPRYVTAYQSARPLIVFYGVTDRGARWEGLYYGYGVALGYAITHPSGVQLLPDSFGVCTADRFQDKVVWVVRVKTGEILGKFVLWAQAEYVVLKASPRKKGGS